MNKVAVIAVIFPSNQPYFDSFLTSIKNQTTNEFDLIIINDGIENISDVVGERKHLFKRVINISGSPFEIRYKAIEEVTSLGYNKIIFSDTDDILSYNRIEILSNQLDHYSIVCNDLDILDEDGKVVERSYWKSRLGEKFVFDQSFIIDKNIIGFGNCGLRSDVTLPQLNNYPNIIAPDWLFFYLLLVLNKEAMFTSECTVGYRQHNNNIIGLKTVNEHRLKKAIDCKIEHYSELVKLGFNFEKELSEHLYLKEATLNDALWIEAVLKRIKKRNLNLFWWEETTI